jgi:hypothetical protein
MANPVSSTSSEHNARVVSHVYQLSPGPQRKVFAIASFALFEFIRRLPIVLFAKQLLVGDGTTSAQKFPHVL